jgi:hypothetical protein
MFDPAHGPTPNGPDAKEIGGIMQSLLRVGLVLTLTIAVASTGFSQAPQAQTAPRGQNRIPQQILINGQTVNGAYVTAANGGMQAYTCPSPQEYVTPDGASRGWACFDSTTNVWLLNALPPAQATQAPPQPAAQPAPPEAPQSTTVYPAPPPVVYTQPTVIYAQPYPWVVAPVYSPSVILGAAAINAFGHIAAAAIIGPYRGFYYPYAVRGWGWRR